VLSMKFLPCMIVLLVTTFQLSAQQAAPTVTGINTQPYKGTSYAATQQLKRRAMDDSMDQSRKRYELVQQLVDDPEWVPQLSSPEARRLWAETLVRNDGSFETETARIKAQDQAVAIENEYRAARMKELTQGTMLTSVKD